MPKYRLTSPRYLNGRYIFASMDEPALVELDASQVSKTDFGLVPVEVPHEKPKAHFVTKEERKESAADVFSKPLKDKPKRASDQEI